MATANLPAVREGQAGLPSTWDEAVQRGINARDGRHAIISKVLKAGVDFGTIPGTQKPTLLDPGAQTVIDALNLYADYEPLTVVEDYDRPLFVYRYRCVLKSRTTDGVIATGIGSCNSREGRYRWRWVKESDLPRGANKSELPQRESTISEFDFAIQKAETSGQYGKPAEYWQRFKDEIKAGTARRTMRKTSKGKSLPAWEIGGAVYCVENEDIFTLVNTIDKMAAKRARVAAVLQLGFSEHFTQDMEDIAPSPAAPEPDDNTSEATSNTDPTPAPGAGKTTKPAPATTACSVTPPLPSDADHPLSATPPPTVKGLPKTGREFAVWSGQLDDAGADAGDWKRGDLMRHMVECAAKEGMGTDMSKWPDNVIPSAIDVARQWEGEHAKPSMEKIAALRQSLVAKGKEEAAALDWVASELNLATIPAKLEELNLYQFRLLDDAVNGVVPKGKKAKKGSAA